jgi:hypothetical protein
LTALRAQAYRWMHAATAWRSERTSAVLVLMMMHLRLSKHRSSDASPAAVGRISTWARKACTQQQYGKQVTLQHSAGTDANTSGFRHAQQQL